MDSKKFVEENVGGLTDLKSFYKFFQGLNYKTLTPDYKGKDAFDLRRYEKEAIEEIYTIVNYKKQFQIFLIKLKEPNSAVIRSLPELFLRESRYPFLVFTPDFVNYTFTFVEKIRKDVGEFQRRIIKLKLDVENPYHTDKLILSNIALKPEIKAPSEINAILKQAFDVEKVTKQFFTEYRAIYELLVEELKKKNKHLAIFKQELSEENFAKKLLGRLTFLYFIQKKGWLGAKEKWGDGDKKFLYHWFTHTQEKNKNYYREVLEPLFFDTLNNPRNEQVDRNYSKRFESNIPFLNGGLFEPDYPWDNPDGFVSIDNNFFEKVFAVFEKYNFTVKEDEPLEKEVAVDPEMLGKVFENLLPENLRKGKGTYYTPREIVHYMCQESLINHLATETGLSVEGVREKYFPVFNTTNDKRAKTRDVETNEKIVKSLKNLKILDPACGSGAFLVGMLQLITKLRFDLEKILFTLRKQKNIPTEYDIKKETIQNSIYGVDIDPGAVEIAKLRLWLSLIVDYEIGEIEPLPNLDYKLMVGNSLLDEFMGIKLFDIEKVKGKKTKRMKTLFEEEPQMSLLEDFSEKSEVLKQLQELQSKLFAESDLEKKKQIKKQIEKIEFDLIDTTVKDVLKKLDEESKYIAGKSIVDGVGIPSGEAEKLVKISSKYNQILESYKEIQKSNVKPFFLFQLHFSDVFEKKGGFDVAIANPPYMKERDNKKVFEIINKSGFGKKYHQGKMDYWYYFLHKAIDLARDDGFICYITSRYWINSTGAKKLIERVKNELSFVNLVDIGNLKVFENVVGQHMIALYTKSKLVKVFTYKKLENDLSDLAKNVTTDNLHISTLNNEEVFNDSQIVFDNDSLSYKDIIALGEISEVIQGVVQNPDKVSNKTAKMYHLTAGEGVFVLRDDEIKGIKINEKEKRFMVDFFDENDIHKYIVLPKKKKFLLYLTKANCPDISLYPNIAAHLIKYKKIMDARRETKKGSNKWFHLHWPRENKYFEGHKIVVPAMFDSVRAGYQEQSGYFGLSTNVITSRNPDYNLKFILAILNSTFANYWFHKHGKKRGVGVDIGVDKLRNFPIRKCELQEQKPIVEIVDRLLDITKNSDYLQNPTRQAQVKDYEKQIDQSVYKLYGLTPEEIKIIKK